MDYIAGHRLPVDMIAGVVEGIARGCRNHAMALAGGETAAMPGLYADHTFDLAGTIVGVVEEDEALHGDRICAGDAILAYASTGLHTNGYTLARRVLLEHLGLTLESPLPDADTSVGDALLAIHQSYDSAIRPVLGQIHGLAHITGGGIPGNLVRVLPEGCEGIIEVASWQWPVLFQVIARGGHITRDEMREVFNLGIGMLAMLRPDDVVAARAAATRAGVATWVAGRIQSGARRVVFAD
jgi:phosphoribosylformylglycinamidine cyclo-ligase